MHTRGAIIESLQKLGVQLGDLLMVHASLKAIGPVEGGAETIVAALRSTVGPSGTLMGYASWDKSPYEETLNGARLGDDARRSWPPFNPATAGTYRGFGLLNQFLVQAPGARRSAHPDASMVAVGPLAETLTQPHELGHALGEGSPIERFVRLGGKVLLLGAPLNSVTALHYAEAVADIPNKRRVTYEMPIAGSDGEVVWKTAADFDSNGILDCFAIEGAPDAVETIATAYVQLGRHRGGIVGSAPCYLFDAQDIVSFGVAYLEQHFGSAAMVPARQGAEFSCEPSG
ncbi:aminoglycoside 3-N-acetyltransferase [Brucella anthropi]|uniref:aminoglycoside 3-N-acetyltransferase n=1 Tax=Brucella anthropi TaxID=529 RepID=UPI00124EC1FE|nr:aminoglycoside 3-N-acetyltransferase [Brucella anthropi]KAB2785011.1 aminoglycoside 3-N-acetyltransferase [Brucella anthropi]